MTLKNAHIAVLLDDPQSAYHLSQVLMKNGAIVYCNAEIERCMARGLVLDVDAEIMSEFQITESATLHTIAFTNYR